MGIGGLVVGVRFSRSRSHAGQGQSFQQWISFFVTVIRSLVFILAIAT